MATIAAPIIALQAEVAASIVLIVPAAESTAFVGLVPPAEGARILGGITAFEHRVPLADVRAARTLGAIIGDITGLAVTCRYGTTLLHKTVGRWVRRDHVERGQAEGRSVKRERKGDHPFAHAEHHRRRVDRDAG